MSKRLKCTMTFELPEEAEGEIGKRQVAEFIKDATMSWGGAFEPANEYNDWQGHPLFRSLQDVRITWVKS